MGRTMTANEGLALGNRSMLADPCILGLKDYLDQEIKFREPFRPHGLVAKAECTQQYFQRGNYDMSFMSLNPQVRPECSTSKR